MTEAPKNAPVSRYFDLRGVLDVDIPPQVWLIVARHLELNDLSCLGKLWQQIIIELSEVLVYLTFFVL